MPKPQVIVQTQQDKHLYVYRAISRRRLQGCRHQHKEFIDHIFGLGQASRCA
jgi:hypothetical protein